MTLKIQVGDKNIMLDKKGCGEVYMRGGVVNFNIRGNVEKLESYLFWL